MPSQNNGFFAKITIPFMRLRLTISIDRLSDGHNFSACETIEESPFGNKQKIIKSITSNFGAFHHPEAYRLNLIAMMDKLKEDYFNGISHDAEWSRIAHDRFDKNAVAKAAADLYDAADQQGDETQARLASARDCLGVYRNNPMGYWEFWASMLMEGARVPLDVEGAHKAKIKLNSMLDCAGSSVSPYLLESTSKPINYAASTINSGLYQYPGYADTFDSVNHLRARETAFNFGLDAVAMAERGGPTTVLDQFNRLLPCLQVEARLGSVAAMHADVDKNTVNDIIGGRACLKNRMNASETLIGIYGEDAVATHLNNLDGLIPRMD